MKRVMFSVLFLIAHTFIANADEVRIVTSKTSHPTNYLENNKLVGLNIDLVQAMLNHMGSKTKIEGYPWARAYNIAKTEPNVAIFTAGKTKERVDHGFHFIGPIIKRDHMLYMKKGRGLNISNIEDIIAQKLTVGGLVGDWRVKYLKDRGVKVEAVSKGESSLKKLLHARIDLIISSDLALAALTKQSGYNANDLEPAFLIKTAPSYIMLSKGTSEENIKKWRDAYAAIYKTDFFNNATKKWSGKLGLNFSSKQGEGYYIKK